MERSDADMDVAALAGAGGDTVSGPPRAGAEAELAAWWAAGGAVGRPLRAADGRAVRVLFAGRRGGPAGPDFRDAVAEIAGQRRAGDIELHRRAAGWHAHGHDRDRRYDGVIVHVVARGPLPDGGTSPLASGGATPLLALDAAPWPPDALPLPLWPCQRQPPPSPDTLRRLGAARFAAKTARLRAALAEPGATLEAVLTMAVAEALGYGRDPAGTRAAWLAAAHRHAGPTSGGPALDALSGQRIDALRGLARDLAARCCGALLAGGAADGWERLLALFAPAGRAIGRARAAIVVWNAVLPGLAAYGDLRGAPALARLARSVAGAAPGLPGNTITRHMTDFLGLTRAPAGALAQQGLHHLHAAWCRAKTCAACPLGWTTGRARSDASRQ